MIDQTTPPFRVGDTAYTAPSPGGYASAAAVPVDPAFGGADDAYTVPSLGGEFQPGSGAAAPTDSPISAGADADGGAADIAEAPRIDEPEADVPPEVPALSVTVDGFMLIFEGVADADQVGDVEYQINGDEVERHIAGIAIPEGTSAGAAAAIVADRLDGGTHTTGATTSNAVTVGTKGANVLDADTVNCTLTPAVADEPEADEPAEESGFVASVKKSLKPSKARKGK